MPRLLNHLNPRVVFEKSMMARNILSIEISDIESDSPLERKKEKKEEACSGCVKFGEQGFKGQKEGIERVPLCSRGNAKSALGLPFYPSLKPRACIRRLFDNICT